MAAQQWKLLSGTKLSEVPEYVTALVKALLCCPPHPSYVVGGEAKLWNSTDIAYLSDPKTKPNVINACKEMRAAKVWLESMPTLNPSIVTGLQGDLDVSIVMMLHKKKAGKSAIEGLETVEDACRNFVGVCESKDIDITDAPWEKLAAATPSEHVEPATKKLKRSL